MTTPIASMRQRPLKARKKTEETACSRIMKRTQKTTWPTIHASTMFFVNLRFFETAARRFEARQSSIHIIDTCSAARMMKIEPTASPRLIRIPRCSSEPCAPSRSATPTM